MVAFLNDTLYLSNKLFTVEHDASLIVLIDIMGTRNSRTVGCMSSAHLLAPCQEGKQRN